MVISIKERVYWNQMAYGSALKINRNWVRILLIVLCIITPFTNWLIPFAGKIIPSDIMIRY